MTVAVDNHLTATVAVGQYGFVVVGVGAELGENVEIA